LMDRENYALRKAFEEQYPESSVEPAEQFLRVKPQIQMML